MGERDLQVVADELAAGGDSIEGPQGVALTETAGLSPADQQGLAGLLVARRCYRVARALLEKLRDREDGPAPGVQGGLDLVNVLCDLTYGTGKDDPTGATPAPFGGLLPAGDHDDEVVTAVRSRSELGDDFTFDDANTGRWAFKVPLADLIASAATAGAAAAGDDAWFIAVADAARAIHDGKCKLARALLEGVAGREPSRSEPVAAQALLALAEGQPAVGMTLLEQARGRLGTQPAIERTAVVLAPHVEQPALSLASSRPAIEGLIGLISGVAVDVLLAPSGNA